MRNYRDLTLKQKANLFSVISPITRACLKSPNCPVLIPSSSRVLLGEGEVTDIKKDTKINFVCNDLLKIC